MSTRIMITALLVALCTGCSSIPTFMRPANWWKLNGQPPGGSDSMYFSVPDPGEGDPFLELSQADTAPDGVCTEQGCCH